MDKVSYKDIGLVTTTEMFAKAMKGKYAIPAYNFNNMEQLQAIVMGCVESKSPFILQVSSGARKYANQTLLRYLAMGAVAMIKDAGSPVKFSLHLDHGDTFELCKSCIDTGFSSVMIDGSHHSYEENVKLTKQVVEYAHAHDVVVEGELGVLAGIEDEVVGREIHLHEARRGRGLREEDRRRFPGHLDRHLPRRHQVQAVAVHARQPGRARAAAAPLRHPRGDREAHSRLPHRAPRRLVGDPRVRRDDQQERRGA